MKVNFFEWNHQRKCKCVQQIIKDEIFNGGDDVYSLFSLLLLFEVLRQQNEKKSMESKKNKDFFRCINVKKTLYNAF